MMRGKPAVLAVVFDFDETLVPDSTSRLLQARGVDPAEFWTVHVRRRLEQGFDPTLAYRSGRCTFAAGWNRASIRPSPTWG